MPPLTCQLLICEIVEVLVGRELYARDTIVDDSDIKTSLLRRLRRIDEDAVLGALIPEGSKFSNVNVSEGGRRTVKKSAPEIGRCFTINLFGDPVPGDNCLVECLRSNDLFANRYMFTSNLKILVLALNLRTIIMFCLL